MLAFIFRGVFLVGVLSWYSTNVWKMIDGYFRDQFQNYLHEELKKNPRMQSDINSYTIKNAEKKGIDLSNGRTLSIPAVPEKERRVEKFLETGTTVDLLASATSFLESMEAKETRSGENRVKVSVDKNTFQKSVQPLEVSSVRKEKPKSSIGSDEFEGRFGVKGKKEKEKQKKEKEVMDNKRKETNDVSHEEREKSFKKIIESTGKKFERSKKRKVKTITLTEADFKSIKRQDDDFSEFDLDDETVNEPSEGILVSKLPFKPRADIGELETVTADEFCPLTLNDKAPCGIPSKWP